LAVCCGTQKAGSFYTDAQNVHRTDKRLVLKKWI
jgi:ribosomal protein L33